MQRLAGYTAENATIRYFQPIQKEPSAPLLPTRHSVYRQNTRSSFLLLPAITLRNESLPPHHAQSDLIVAFFDTRSALSKEVSSMEATLKTPTWLYNPALMRSSSRHRALICSSGQCRRGVEKHIASGSMSHFAAEYEPLIHGRWQRQRRQGNSPMMPGHSSP